jgi:hypothetical protein
MASDLIVGPLDSDVQDHVRRICKRIGLRKWSPTIGPVGFYRRMITHRAQPITERVIISLLNNASLDAFNTFSAGLEGLSELDAIEKTAFRNLPWWLDSFWLPVEFDPPKEPVSDKDGPIFVGSSIRLLNELVRIKQMSPLEVGTFPPTIATCGMTTAAGSPRRTSYQKTTRSDGFGTLFAMARRFLSSGNFR